MQAEEQALLANEVGERARVGNQVLLQNQSSIQQLHDIQTGISSKQESFANLNFVP
jgi:hypothetical protein